MGELSDQNLHAKMMKKAILELLKGKEITTQLQTLLNKRAEDRGLVSIHDLAVKISRSFRNTLSLLSFLARPAQIGGGDGDGSACSGGRRWNKAAVAVKNRRGCYMRRKTSESWVTMSPVMEDGYVWRKYGQKNILNFKNPRCYYRCTYKYQGCKATKQVQIIKENSTQYQTTYFHPHTCKNHTLMFDPQIVVDQDSSDFESYVNPPVKQDIHSPKGDQHDCDDGKPSLGPWQDIFGLEPLGYKPELALLSSSYQEEVFSGLSSCESSGLQWPQFNQLGDMDDDFLFN